MGKPASDEEKKRITIWTTDLDWVNNQKRRIEKSGKVCEIRCRENAHALFYRDGHFTNNGQWIEREVVA
jgi:hypothetical protein